MKKIILLSGILLCISAAGFAQYGRLEPIKEGDTSLYVLRTPKETLKKLSSSADQKIKKDASLIEHIEQQLDFVRYGYLANRIPTISIQSFIANIKLLQADGIDASYYIKEFFIYYPGRNSR